MLNYNVKSFAQSWHVEKMCVDDKILVLDSVIPGSMLEISPHLEYSVG